MEKKIISIIEMLTGEEFPDANGDSNIISDFALDSLQMVNFFLNLEDEFEVPINFESFDYELLQSVSKVADYIRSNMDE
ncbi:MAG: acyl carrier protein [Oscillospiraceae bacterium]|nr:acyl carrier protein [Oscillospiraceae bacterium]